MSMHVYALGFLLPHHSWVDALDDNTDREFLLKVDVSTDR